MKKFPFCQQLDAMDCGPACLKMISEYYGKNYNLQFLRDKCSYTREGVSLQGIIDAAELIGYKSFALKIPFWEQNKNECKLLNLPLPLIAHWNQNHFIIVYKVSDKYIWIADPASDKQRITYQAFQESWVSDAESGIVLLLEPTSHFFAKEPEKVDESKLKFILRYFYPLRKYFYQLLFGLVLSSLFQIVLPFFARSVVDIGINASDINFIYLVFLAQIIVFIGEMTIYAVQSLISLHLSTRINISMVSDFLFKLTKLPIRFFDTKMTGDILQRISDHKRIESFITIAMLNAFQSLSSIIVLGGVLLLFSQKVFFTFTVFSILYIVWVSIFLSRRRRIDSTRFSEQSKDQDCMLEIIQGMQEIQLQNSEMKHRLRWTDIQTRLFDVNLSALKIAQWQELGGNGIIRLKDIIISLMSANAVITGEMTLGTMISIQYVIGQINIPLQRLTGLIQSAQDANISIERLNEIHKIPNGNIAEQVRLDFIPDGDIKIEDMSFKYAPAMPVVLKNINLTIPRGKVTAIVGSSGSGKTTLIKLLLGFYNQTLGNIRVGNTPISGVDEQVWRRHCSAVLQDSYIFSDTIAANIAESDTHVDKRKLSDAIEISNIQPFIESLPLNYNTIVGNKGNGMSQGQKQRILIARAIYKQPDFIFLDEATNALDANNERTIMNNRVGDT